MNNIKNSVRLIGNLGATPEFKSLESGAKMARVSLATSEFHYEPDPTATLGKKKVTVTQWHPLIFWGKQAELAAKYLSKGNEIAIQGKLTHRSYETKEGEKKYISEIVVHELVMMNRSSQAA